MQLTQTPYNRLVPYEAPERSGEFCSFFEDEYTTNRRLTKPTRIIILTIHVAETTSPEDLDYTIGVNLAGPRPGRFGFLTEPSRHGRFGFLTEPDLSKSSPRLTV